MSNPASAFVKREPPRHVTVVDRAVVGINPKTSRPRVAVMGHIVDKMTGREVLGWIQYAARGRRKALIGTHNLNSFYLADRNPDVARLYQMADIVQVDSLPLLKFAKMTGKEMGPEHLSAYLFWRDNFWAMCQRFGLRVYYLGGEPNMATGAIRMIEMAYPDVRFSGRDRYFDGTREGAENQSVLSTVRRFAPDILLVNLGSPRQEAWIAENYSDLPPCVVMPISAAFDYELGPKADPAAFVGADRANLFQLCGLLKPAFRDMFKRPQ